MISVIIPVYNQTKKLKQSLISLTKQSYNDFEVIIVDDGSIDSTRGIIKKLAKAAFH